MQDKDEQREQAEVLLQKYQSLVRTVARRHFRKSAITDDLLQCGTIGLWKACTKWDSTRPFLPFAMVCIRNELFRHARREARSADDVPLPLPPLEELAVEEGQAYEDAALKSRICAAWPCGSIERDVLLSLGFGEAKSSVATRLGMSTYALTQFSRAAWAKVK